MHSGQLQTGMQLDLGVGSARPGRVAGPAEPKSEPLKAKEGIHPATVRLQTEKVQEGRREVRRPGSEADSSGLSALAPGTLPRVHLRPSVAEVLPAPSSSPLGYS